MTKKALYFILFGIFLISPCKSQDVEWAKYGYVKYMFSISKRDFFSEDKLTDHIVHIRFNNRLYFMNYFTAALELRMQAFQGSSVKNALYTPQNNISPYPYSDMDAVFWQKSSHFAYGQIDRLFLDYSKDNWQITMGRQRIAWGTSLVWNITDLFNPQSILDFDYEEKPGTDAVRIQYFTDVIGRVELVFKPAPEKIDRSLALLYLINKWDYDFYFIAALHREKPLLGTAFAGDIEGAGFRGEFTATGRPVKSQLKGAFSPLPFLSEEDKPNISAVLSFDYTFASSLYLHSEVLYNSLGKTDNNFLYAKQAYQAGLLSPSRTTLFFETAYDLHPLVRGNIFTLINPHEQSIIYAPSISWSVITNLDLYLIGLISAGDKQSEYSYWGKAFFIRTKYSF